MSTSGGTTAGTSGAPGITKLIDAGGVTQAQIAAPSDTNIASDLFVAAQLELFDLAGGFWVRARHASAANLIAQSGLGAALVSPPGEWAVISQPAVNTQASASQAAGGASVRHVLTDASATLSGDATGNADNVIFNLRDGATGAGTVKKVGRSAMIAGVDNEGQPINWPGLTIPGTAATAATMESSAAPALHSFATATIAGFDAT